MMASAWSVVFRRASIKLVFFATLAATQAEAAIEELTVYSPPIRLRYGQVFQKSIELVDIPADLVARYADGTKVMAVSGGQFELVRFDKDGKEMPVSLHDHYLHHALCLLAKRDGKPTAVTNSFIVSEIGWQTIHNATGKNVARAGSDCRGPRLELEKPFRILIAQPEVVAFSMHVINTNRAGERKPSPLVECPCTPERRKQLLTRKAAPNCSAALIASGNTACNWSTYVAGVFCCHDQGFLIDTTEECSDSQCSEAIPDLVYGKVTVFYEDAEPGARDVERGACCSATSGDEGKSQKEFDIPKCAAGTPQDECVFYLENVQELAYNVKHKGSYKVKHHLVEILEKNRLQGDDLVYLVNAQPHLHMNALSIQLIDDVTGEVICEMHQTEDNKGGIMSGRGTAAGDEIGFLVGVSQCTWDGKNARQYRRDHPFRVRGVYNASTAQRGVMANWKLMVSPVDPKK